MSVLVALTLRSVHTYFQLSAYDIEEKNKIHRLSDVKIFIEYLQLNELGIQINIIYKPITGVA